VFEKREDFRLKIPVLILMGIVILGSGIYIGIKTKSSNSQLDTEVVNYEDETEAFSLLETCEIWVEKRLKDGTKVNGESLMIGIVPKEIITKTQEEIIAYLTEKYPTRNIESIKQNKIVLSEFVEGETTTISKYSLENLDGFVTLYKYDENGEKTIVEKTQIDINVLPSSTQEELEAGIYVNTEDEAYSKLENFGS
jgi:hypothetical protein